ncbi:CpsD/CapB family tyrosine-protein kinase [Alisedimentitalea sp. MJ-SS2]|uniref:CpsD/CapB family tyrosine-protein kinase n=1 Tax=Aliisedimentitalea sp. MJ-SS2 TaxID=3049795 RepID=UPI0029111291|nr:CpsD/CapB family tyrosine-protein kinase [Alisedimentitalea sp. MJ-SS2]MDU8926228.1 CpsD/CapB family tyrosine-protein kinase [Alisedimentitalea sp. MJ-SS2]
MSDDRPRFTRKSRRRTRSPERERLIAEIANRDTPHAAPEILDLPNVTSDAPMAEVSGEWHPELDPMTEATLAAEESFATSDAATQIEQQVPEVDHEVLFGGAASDSPNMDQPSEMDANPETEPETQPEPEPEPNTLTESQVGETWSHLASIPVDPAHLERNLIITAGRHDPAHGAFDVLRTRLVQTLYDNDWKRVAVTSPTRDCGKTFTAVNLAISLSRYESMRTVLMDMDMRNPSVASVLGAANPGSMGDFLSGASSVHDHFIRLGRNALNIGNNLAVGLNDRVEAYASEMFQDPRTDDAFARMMQELDPDVVLYDLPPALAYDDVIAFKKYFDGVLMVVGGGSTTADEVHEAMRRIGDDVPLLGVVLNQAENEGRTGYTYGY